MPKKAKVFAEYALEEDYIFGIPARDLTKKEWFALPEERRKLALKVGTHKLVEKEEKPADEEGGEVKDG